MEWKRINIHRGKMKTEKELKNYYCDVLEEMGRNYREREKEILKIIDKWWEKTMQISITSTRLEELKSKIKGEK